MRYSDAIGLYREYTPGVLEVANRGGGYPHNHPKNQKSPHPLCCEKTRASGAAGKNFADVADVRLQTDVTKMRGKWRIVSGIGGLHNF